MLRLRLVYTFKAGNHPVSVAIMDGAMVFIELGARGLLKPDSIVGSSTAPHDRVYELEINVPDELRAAVVADIRKIGGMYNFMVNERDSDEARRSSDE